MAPIVLFQLRPGFPILSEIQRILLEQVDAALHHLSAPGPDIDRSVHEARKCFKCLRGTLRLVRDEIPASAYARLNLLFRDIARQLSDIRSSAVLAETWLAVQKRHPQLPAEPLLTQLQDWHRQVFAQRAPQQLLPQLHAQLLPARELIAALPLTENRFPRGGMRRVYARGRRAMLLCQQQPAVHHFHNWRKRVKYLRFHMRILTPTWPEVLTCTTREWVKLSDLLGDDHDLADLAHALQAHPHRFQAPPAALTYIQQDQRTLQQRSLTLGARLYAEKPSNFVHRIESYWRAW